eukprot:13692355-Heterocapsa_arctica.AAC.1
MGAEDQGERPGEHNSIAGRYAPQDTRNGAHRDGEEHAQAVSRCVDQWAVRKHPGDEDAGLQ